jgi:hypothetical protein
VITLKSPYDLLAWRMSEIDTREWVGFVVKTGDLTAQVASVSGIRTVLHQVEQVLDHEIVDPLTSARSHVHMLSILVEPRTLILMGRARVAVMGTVAGLAMCSCGSRAATDLAGRGSDGGAASCTCLPTTFAAGQSVPHYIAINSTNLYWTNLGVGGMGGMVMQAPIGGGTPNELASTQASAGLAANATGVYWGDEFTSSIMMVPIGQGTPVALGSGADVGVPWGVTVDDTHVYWTDLNGQMIKKMPLAGGAAVTLASGQVQARGIAVDATSVYWTDYATQGTVIKVPLAGGTPITLASGQDAALDIAVDSANVYWANWGPGADTGSVSRVPIDGGPVTVLATGQQAPSGLAVNGGYLYWGTFHGNGAVMKVPVGGGAPVTVAAAQDGPAEIVFGGDNSMYWTNAGGTVMRLGTCQGGVCR